MPNVRGPFAGSTRMLISLVFFAGIARSLHQRATIGVENTVVYFVD